jgi:hypothetical protein
MAPTCRTGLTMALIALPLMVGIACAQAPKGPDDHADKPNSLPDQNATQEPSAKTNPNTQPTGVFVNGALAVAGAPAETETTPAKFSAHNDARDKIPIMARGPWLTDVQKQRIAAAVTQARVASTDVKAMPTTELSSDVELRDWPAGLATDIPAVNGTKYVRLADKILIVQPANRIVIGEIAP